MKRTIVPHGDSAKASKWLSKHEQTHNGVKFMKKIPKANLTLFTKNQINN